MFNFIKKLLGITEEKSVSKKVSMPLVLTRDVKQQLFDLGYPKHAVKSLSAIQAARIIKKGRTYHVH